MSKLIYVCFRDRQKHPDTRKILEESAEKILPDNIVARPSFFIEEEGILASLYNPTATIKVNGISILLGYAIEAETWHEISQNQPEGTYALIRGDNNYIQVLSDVVASRTIWYFIDNEKFIAATSQRALISALGNFEFNEKTIPWMLATGTLGPDNSWDRRIKRMGGDSILTLDRKTWNITEFTKPIQFTSPKINNQTHAATLSKTLNDNFHDFNLDYSQWILLLSGGFDSRSILCLLNNKENLKAITWGTRAALSEAQSDAQIAKQLASHFKLQHTYFETDLTDDDIEKIFNRYLICGEGEIDHIAGYMDGFATWKKLFEAGVQGVIRGDEGFGWVPVSSPLDVRMSVGIPLWSDFSNLMNLSDLGLPGQEFPEKLKQRNGESLEAWRDRLYHQFRIPVVLAALSDLKLAYVELVNPLLTQKIIHAARALPDHLRTDKRLYKKIITALSPAIAFAKHQALAAKRNILKEPAVVEYLRQRISSIHTMDIFSEDFLKFINSRLESINEATSAKKGSGVKGIIKRFLPRWLLGNIKKSAVKPKLDINLLTFRVFVITRMHEILTADVRDRQNKT